MSKYGVISILFFSVKDSEFEFDEVHKHSEFECDEVNNDAKVTEKNTALRTALSQLAYDFGTESMLSLQRFFGARRAPVISTGSLKLDQALGIGGLPKVIFCTYNNIPLI